MLRGLLVLWLGAASATNLVVESGSYTLSTGAHTFTILNVTEGATLYIDGAVNITANAAYIMGTVNGKGRSSFASALGPGTPATTGCTWSTGDSNRDRAASYGGIGAGASAECAYGSTFFPIDPGSSGNGGTGGAALRLDVTGELHLDGTIIMDAADPSTDWSGGSGGSVWVSTGTLRGSGGVVSASGGTRNRYGNAGGGGGRLALYCAVSEYESAAAHGWALPALQAYGGQGSADDWDGGCGTVYINCGNVTNTLLLDNAARDATPLQTKLVDSGTTTFAFDEVKLLGSAKLGFAPWSTGSSAITVSIGSTTGDGSGTLVAESMAGRTDRVVLVLTGRLDGQAFVTDSNYQASSLTSQGSSLWEIYWTRLYHLSDLHVLSNMNVEVATGSEMVVRCRASAPHPGTGSPHPLFHIHHHRPMQPAPHIHKTHSPRPHLPFRSCPATSSGTRHALTLSRCRPDWWCTGNLYQSTAHLVVWTSYQLPMAARSYLLQQATRTAA